MNYLNFENNRGKATNKNNHALLSIDSLTIKYIDRFIKQHKDIMNTFFNAYSNDIREQHNLIALYNSIKALKKAFYIYIGDVYYDNDYLCNNYSIDSYINYANKRLNHTIKSKIA